MKTLNDKIIFQTTFPASTVDQSKTYTLNYNGNPLFKGTVFVPKSDTPQTIEICLNDILKSEVEKITVLDEHNSNEYDPIRNYTISINGRTYSLDTVFLGYLNKLHNYSLRPLMTKEQVASEQAKKQLAPMLQGINNYPLNDIPSQKLDLYPRYPFVLTDQLNLSQLFNVGDAHNTIQYGIKDKDKNIYIYGSFSHNNYVDNLVCPLNYMLEELPVINGKKDIIVQSSALTETKITGKKLFRVELDGQFLYQNQDVWEFLSEFGYPGQFYAENFHIQEVGNELIPFIVETNDPVKDIQDVFNSYTHLGESCSMSYSEIQSSSNCILSYEPINTGPMSDAQYNAFNKFMASISYNYITTEIISEWGIAPNTPMPDPVQLRFPFIVPDLRQLDIWKTNFQKFQDKDTYTYEDFFVASSGETGSITGKSSTYKEEHIPIPIKIGEFDECPAKYYLQWIDRYKGVQCQPFNGKSTASISYNVQNIINRYNEKRPISFDNTYTFDLNTGWLSDKEYPLFESLFVSPDLKLYDTENNISYKVIVVDKQFVEKTYKNQKKMFGFNIKVQINNNENIIY